MYTTLRNLLFLIPMLGILGLHQVYGQQKQLVDLIVYNTHIYTVDKDFSTAEAMAVSKKRFVAVGSTSDILAAYDAEQMLDANGHYIYPGFNDGHSHFLGYGNALIRYANLKGTMSYEEVLEQLEQHARNYPSEWILGRGWDQNDWEDKSFPTNKELNKLFPNNAVVLIRIDGHAVLANDVALKKAGIHAKTKIHGGEILLENGVPTGVLIDNAADSLKSLVPPLSKAHTIAAFERAEADCFAVGLTTVTDAGMTKANVLLLDSLHQSGAIQMRVYAMLHPSLENIGYFFPKGPVYTNKLTVSSVKLYVDGALGSRGALLLEPYSDDPDNIGLQLESNDYYKRMCKLAYESGYQVNTHAIGDSGNRLMLRTYADLLQEPNDRRWRIEHAQIVSHMDLSFFSEYSVIPSVQATHCTSDMYWADERLGPERIKTAYAYKDLLSANGWLVNGTDFPIENINPLHTFYASVHRKDLHGWPEHGFQMENALSRKEALYSITLWPAKGSFDEDIKGSIEVGKWADFVLLNQDIMEIPMEDLPHTEVVATYLDGIKVYENK